MNPSAQVAILTLMVVHGISIEKDCRDRLAMLPRDYPGYYRQTIRHKGYHLMAPLMRRGIVSLGARRGKRLARHRVKALEHWAECLGLLPSKASRGLKAAERAELGAAIADAPAALSPATALSAQEAFDEARRLE